MKETAPTVRTLIIIRVITVLSPFIVIGILWVFGALESDEAIDAMSGILDISTEGHDNDKTSAAHHHSPDEIGCKKMYPGNAWWCPPENLKD